MSKRVSNKKGPARKTLARSKVRFGWRKKLAFTKAFAIEAQRRTGLVTSE